MLSIDNIKSLRIFLVVVLFVQTLSALYKIFWKFRDLATIILILLICVWFILSVLIFMLIKYFFKWS